MAALLEIPPAWGVAVPTPPYALHLSRLIWNLRARAERGEPVAHDLAAALAERARLRAGVRP